MASQHEHVVETNWVRRGRIHPGQPSNGLGTHASLPIAQSLGGDLVRVHFCSRDGKGRSRIGQFETSLSVNGDAERTSCKLTVGLGPLGAFDDSGVTSSCLVENGGRHYLYYTGWSLGVTVPFYFGIGLAVSDDGGESFEKVSAGPVMGRNRVDPFLCASPSILVEEGTWRMWYVSGRDWQENPDGPRHRYHIRYAESKDGVEWRREGTVCIDFANDDEYAFGRPCVLKDGDRYRMWYCSRGDRYRLGYAESADGIDWERRDGEAGLEPAPDEWDSEMIAYPFVFDHSGKRWMLYNGNGYGRTGIGLAEWRPCDTGGRR